jgi:DNA modification methylase
MSIIVDKRDIYSHLISPRRDFDKPIYNWHSFKHSYSKDLVDNVLSEFKLKKGSWVMDPFCGGGTTLLASKQAGLNAHGFDILPFSVFLSNVKTTDYNIKKLQGANKRFENLENCSSTLNRLPEILILRKAFNKSTENQLLQLKEQIQQIPDSKIQDFFNLAFLSILESVSNTSKSGGFLRIVNRDVNPDQIRTLFLSKIHSMISDVEINNHSNHKNEINIQAFLGDARQIPNSLSYNAIITSPPYPNRHDYTRIYSLELAFDFIKNNDDLKKIRYETLRSHVEAKKKYEAISYRRPLILKKSIELVEKNGVNNPQIIGMLNGYFEDMYLALTEMSQHLNNKGKIAMVISNVRFAGINIPVDEILLKIGRQANLKPKGIWIARYRGNSSQQMKTYKRMPSRESIIIFEK